MKPNMRPQSQQSQKNKFEFRDEHFGPLAPYINDDNVTDINYNGTDVWIDDLTRGRYKCNLNLTPEFVNQFTVRIADRVSENFNQYNPLLEAETNTLRISIIHESVLNTGRSISIRKTPIIKRLTTKKMLNENYCTPEILNLLISCIDGKMNMMMCGLPGTGKTELLKFLTGYIPDNERVITIEDNLEIHYSEINPGKDCVEMKVDDDRFSYVNAIKACLRQAPQWILLSEARSTEVKYLIESMSTGTHCLTTIHTDDVRKVPDRVKNMIQDGSSADKVVNDIYSFLDVAVLIKRNFHDGRITRYIDQVCFFSRENGDNVCILIADDGKVINREIPYEVRRKFEESNVFDVFGRSGKANLY
jgi:pilus assembly protein CpaF